MKIIVRVVSMLLAITMVMSLAPATFAVGNLAFVDESTGSHTVDAPYIDFTNPKDAAKFDVVNKKDAAIVEGKGLTLTATRPAFEPCNGQNFGGQANCPEDVISVPVIGDWEATLEFVFSTGSARNGYYQFFGFYAAERDDFQNLAGIRGGDGALANFLRVDGMLTADSSDLNSTPGLANNGATYWFRITKEDTTYTCARSSDGKEFTDMFSYENTDIEADRLIIDAYTGLTAGYQFTLKTLTLKPQTTANIKLEGIAVNGKSLADFAPSKYSYTVTLESGAEMPVVEAQGRPGMEVKVVMPESLPGVATITSTDPISNDSVTYTIIFKVKTQALSAPATIDFTNLKDVVKFDVVNKKDAAIVEGKGLTLTATRPAFEPCNGQNFGDQANCPEDVISVPVIGDWEATLEFVFSTGSARNGYYQCF